MLREKEGRCPSCGTTIALEVPASEDSFVFLCPGCPKVLLLSGSGSIAVDSEDAAEALTGLSLGKCGRIIEADLSSRSNMDEADIDDAFIDRLKATLDSLSDSDLSGLLSALDDI